MTADERGLALSGADGAQAAALDAGMRDFLDYRLSAFPALKSLCEAAPEFPMAHLLKGFLLLAMGTRDTVPAARACCRQVTTQAEALNPRERAHLQALSAWARGDTLAACRCWDELLVDHPRDLLALKLQHFLLFWMGRADHMRDAAARVLPAWDQETPGYPQLLGFYAFGLEETGSYPEAERLGREAVERHPDDLWAIHAVAHVYEMQGRLGEGTAWLSQPIDRWDDRNPFKGHLWWHSAMFAFEKGDFPRVVTLYDAAVRPDDSTFYLDIQNAASLLARLELAGVEVGDRWDELADAAQSRQGDHVLVFTEPHYTMAFGRTGRFDQAERQIASFRDFAAAAGNSGSSVVEAVAAPLCEAIRDFYKGEHSAAVERMMAIRYDYQLIGGSHAQRDVFALFLIEAAARAGKLSLARALLAERVSRHRNSFASWRRYAEVCARLGDEPAALEARAQAERIAAAA